MQSTMIVQDVLLRNQVMRSISTIISRRAALQGAASFSIAGCAVKKADVSDEQKDLEVVESAPQPTFQFKDLPFSKDEQHHVAEGYLAEPLLSWGDPLVHGLAPFDPNQQEPEEQKLRFGYNNDFIAFCPLEQNRALLVVNHESTFAGLMFEGEKGYSVEVEQHIRIEQLLIYTSRP